MSAAVKATLAALTGDKAGGSTLLSKLSGLHRTQLGMIARGSRPLTQRQAMMIAAGLRDHAERCQRLAGLVERGA